MTEITNFNFSGNIEADAEALRQEMIKLAKKHNMNINQFVQSYKEFLHDPNLPPKDVLEYNLRVLGSKIYVSQLQHHIKLSLNYNWENGIWTAKAPIGYKNYRDKNGKAQIKVDPNRADKILKLFEARAKGLSLSQLKKYATELNLTYSKSKPYILKKSQISRILHNPFYTGTMIIKKVAYPHNYPKIVSKELFDKVQQTFCK